MSKGRFGSIPGMPEVPTQPEVLQQVFPRTEDLGAETPILSLDRILDSKSGLVFGIGVAAIIIATPFVAFTEEIMKNKSS